MNAISARLRLRLANIAIYAYRTLVLSFFILFLLRFSARDGGWINEFIVFLILLSAFAIAPGYRRLRRKQLGSD